MNCFCNYQLFHSSSLLLINVWWTSKHFLLANHGKNGQQICSCLFFCSINIFCYTIAFWSSDRVKAWYKWSVHLVIWKKLIFGFICEVSVGDWKLYHHAEKFFPCCQLQSLICSEFCHTIPRPPDFHENKILQTLDDCIYLLIVFSVHVLVKTVRMALLCRWKEGNAFTSKDIQCKLLVEQTYKDDYQIKTV